MNLEGYPILFSHLALPLSSPLFTPLLHLLVRYTVHHTIHYPLVSLSLAHVAVCVECGCQLLPLRDRGGLPYGLQRHSHPHQQTAASGAYTPTPHLLLSLRWIWVTMGSLSLSLSLSPSGQAFGGELLPLFLKIGY